MSRLRDAVLMHGVDEEQIHQRLTQSLNLKPRKPRFWSWKTGLALGAASALTLTILFQNGLPLKDKGSVMIAIDINPSFALRVDDQQLVIAITPLNADAKTMQVNDLVGWPAENVVEAIILRAQQAGFIITDDDNEDFVLITTAPLASDHQSDADALNDSLTLRFAKEDATDDLSVILIKSDLEAQRNAQAQDIPLGLYVINGLIQVGDQLMSVSEFMNTDGNPELLATIADIIPRADLNAVSLIGRFLDRLEDAGVDIDVLRDRLNTTDEDLIALKTDVLTLWEALDEPTRVILREPTDSIIGELRGMIRTLRLTGIDVSNYITLLKTPTTDYAVLKKTLVDHLISIGIDPNQQPEDPLFVIKTRISASILALNTLGYSTTDYQTRLTDPDEDLIVLYQDILKFAESNGILLKP
jgi:hypothetical protein